MKSRRHRVEVDRQHPAQPVWHISIQVLLQVA